MEQHLSDDEQYLIVKPSRKWKTFRRTDTDAPAGPGKFGFWELVGGAETYEQAVEWAKEDSAKRSALK